MIGFRHEALLAATAAGALSTLAWSAPAGAAAQLPCAPATITPYVTTVPANLPGFGYTALKATANDVHLTMQSSGAPTPVAVTVGPVADGYLKIAPSAPLTVGATYELTFDAFCSYGPYPAKGPLQFTVTDAAPLPSKLGALDGAPTFDVKDFGTSRYRISAKYNVDPEMKPWVSVYTLGVLFDGKPIETKAAVSAAGDAVQVDATGWCDATTAQKNQHDVVLRARLPFATTVQTAASTLTFSCPAPNHVTPAPAAIPPSEPPSPPADGGVDKVTTTTTQGGCTVSQGVRSASSGSFAVVAFALGLAVRRRRRGALGTKGGV